MFKSIIYHNQYNPNATAAALATSDFLILIESLFSQLSIALEISSSVLSKKDLFSCSSLVSLILVLYEPSGISISCTSYRTSICQNFSIKFSKMFHV